MECDNEGTKLIIKSKSARTIELYETMTNNTEDTKYQALSSLPNLQPILYSSEEMIKQWVPSMAVVKNKGLNSKSNKVKGFMVLETYRITLQYKFKRTT